MEGLYLLLIFHPVKYMTILFRLFLMVTFLMETFYRYIYDCFQSVLNIKSYLVYIYILKLNSHTLHSTWKMLLAAKYSTMFSSEKHFCAPFLWSCLSLLKDYMLM